MREIKFRGKLKEHFGDKNGNVVLQKGTWIYGGIVFDENRVWIDTKYYGEIIVDKDTIGQYTGLKDKNGKEIYEGDIVKIDNDVASMFNIKSTGKVEYNNGLFLVRNEDEIGILFSLFVLADIKYCLRGEVIGNIYGNPELLEKGKE